MYTHQEVIENNRIYNAYKNQRINFSSQVARSIGLKQQDTVVKIGMDKTRGALVSASMDDLVVLTKLNSHLQKKIYSANGMVTVQLKFYDSLFKKEMSFNLYTKFLNMNNHGLPEGDMRYLSLKLRRRIPNDLISVFGKHHEKVSSAATVLNKNIEGMLFVRGIKKACFPAYIDEDKVLINYLGNPQAFLQHKAMLVLKSVQTGDTFEVIGKIDEDVLQQVDAFQLKLNYSIDQQSPRFSSSLEELTRLVNG